MTRPAAPVSENEGPSAGGCGCLFLALFFGVYLLLDVFFFTEEPKTPSAPPAPPACVDGQVVREVLVRDGDLAWCDEAGRIRVRSPPRVRGGLYAVVRMNVLCPCSGEDARLEVDDG